MGNVYFTRTADEIRSTIPSLIQIGTPDNRFIRDQLGLRAKELISMYNRFANLEKDAYKKMGVSSLEELQGLVDAINESGLVNLSARMLGKFKIVKAARESVYQLKEVEEKLTEFFLDRISEDPIDEYVDIWAEQKIEDALQELAKQVGGSKKRESGSYSKATLSNLRKKLIIRPGSVKIAGGKISALGAYKKDIIALLDIKKQTNESLEFQINMDYELIESTEQTDKLNYYPYFVSNNEITEEELRSENGIRIWQAFKNQVKSLCPMYSKIIEEVMDSMGPGAFIIYNAADMIGIFGELQMMVILNVIGGINDLNAQFTGHMRNELKKSAKIGIDALLDSIGFQVKNYSGYTTETGDTGINLSENWTLKYFLSKISGFLPVTEIGKFYALQSYHVKVDNSFSDVISSFETISRGLNQTYLGYVDRFLPFEEQVQLKDETEEMTMRNLFWFIGGTKIVPSSRIIYAYLRRIQAIIKQTGSGRGLSVKSSYHGPTYATYMQDLRAGKKASMPSLDEIQNNIHMKVTINLHMPSLLNEIIY